MIEQRQRGLNVLHLNLGFQQQFFQFGAGVVAVGIHAADGDALAGMARKGHGIGAALIFRQLNMLDPLELQQGKHLFAGQLAFFNILLVEGIHILTIAARRAGAGHLLNFNGQMNEPEGLNGFAEVAGREFGHATADFRNFQQFGPGLGIGFGLGRLFGQIRIAMRMGNDRFRGHDHGAIQIVLFLVGQRGGAIQQTLLDVVDDPAQTLVQRQRIIGNTGTAGHADIVIIDAGLGIGRGIEAVLVLEHLVVQVDAGASLPLLVGLFQQLGGFLRNLHFAQRGHLGHLHFFLDPGNIPLGIGIHTGTRSGKRPHDGVAVQKDLFLQQDALQQLGADVEHRFALKFLVHFIQELQALGVHDLRRVHEIGLEFLYTRFSGIPVDGVTLSAGGACFELMYGHDNLLKRRINSVPGFSAAPSRGPTWLVLSVKHGMCQREQRENIAFIILK